MKALDDERRSVARAFGHELPNLIDEMKRIGTVEHSIDDSRISLPQLPAVKRTAGSRRRTLFEHRYYREDFGHGLLPFIEIARIAGIETPVARSLLVLAETMTGVDYREGGRTAEAMGIAGLDKAGLKKRVRGSSVSQVSSSRSLPATDASRRLRGRRCLPERRCVPSVFPGPRRVSRASQGGRSRRGSEGCRLRTLSHSRHRAGWGALLALA